MGRSGGGVRGMRGWVWMLSVVAACGWVRTVQGEESKWMFGDWNGKRTELHERGYDFNFDYIGEAASNVQGGYNRDASGRYTDQMAFGAHLDLEKILGWNDTEFQVAITKRTGQSLARERIGDPRAPQISSEQQIWGRGQNWRLTQFWFKKTYLDGALELKAGRFSPGEDFNRLPCDFQNLAICGSQVGHWAGSVWYSSPVSQWGANVRYNISPRGFVQIAAFEQNPSNLDRRRGFTFSTHGRLGTIVPVEVVWRPVVGEDKLPGEYRLGYYYSSSPANDVYMDINGQPQAVSGEPFKVHGGKHGSWGVMQQQLTARGGDPARGLKVFAGFTTHDTATSLVDNFQEVGLIYKGPFNARPLDDVGIGIGRMHVNEKVRQRQQLLNEVTGISNYDDPLFQPVQGTEYDVELYYGVRVNAWLTVRPNLQYVRRPGGVAQVDDAFVAGLKLKMSF